MIRYLLAAVLALMAAAAIAQSAVKTFVQTERVRAELLAHAPDGIASGRSIWVGLQLAHALKWHTYWKNPGDSGLPTSLAWDLPEGVSASDIQWPRPRKFPIGDLANYGYEGTVLLPVPLAIGPSFQPSSSGILDLKLKASWLVCKEECIPEEGEFALKVPLASATAAHASDFQAAFDLAPRTLPPGRIRVDAETLRVELDGLPAHLRGTPLEVFPELGGLVEPARAWTQAWNGERWSATTQLSPQQ